VLRSWATERLKEVDGIVKIVVALVVFLITGLVISLLAGKQWYVARNGSATVRVPQ